MLSIVGSGDSRGRYESLQLTTPQPAGARAADDDVEAQRQPAEPKLGDYARNKKIFDTIWTDNSSKRGFLAELGRNQGLDFITQTVTSAIVTAMIYWVSTTILSKAPNVQSLADQIEAPGWVSGQIALVFDDPATRQELARYLAMSAGASAMAAQGSGGANQLVITQAITNAINQMGSPIGALLKAIVLPQRGSAVQSQMKQAAFRAMSTRVQACRDLLPPDRREKFDFAVEDLRSQIDSIGKQAYGDDYNQIKRLFDRVYLHLSYPTDMENVYQLDTAGDPEKAQQIGARQAALVSSFMNERLSVDLDDALKLARYSTVNPGIGVVVIWCVGPPSVGKTWVAQQAAVEVLNARFLEMGVPEFCVHAGEAAPARPFEWNRTEPDIDRIREPHKGRIMDATNLNELILIDEVDFRAPDEDDPELKNGGPDLPHMEPLKRALTRHPTQYPAVPILGFRPTATPVLFVCSNHEFDFDRYQPLGTRITKYIRFPNWSREAYRRRIGEYVEKLLTVKYPPKLAQRLVEQQRTDYVHSQQVREAARVVFERLAVFIMEQLEEHDCFKDLAPLYLRDVHSALKLQSSKIFTELDASRQDFGSEEFMTLRERVTEQARHDVRRHFDDAIARSREKAERKRKAKEERQARKAKDRSEGGPPPSAAGNDVSGLESLEATIKRLEQENRAQREQMDKDRGKLEALAQRFESLLTAAAAQSLNVDQGRSTAVESSADTLRRRGGGQADT